MFSTDFIFRQQENLVDNQKCQAGFRQLCNKIVNLPLVQDTKGSPLNPEGQVQTGLSDPDLSLPGWQVAPEPQGLGVHKSFRVNSRQDTNGSPVNPGINEK